MLPDLAKYALHAACGRLFRTIPNNPSYFQWRLLNIFSLAMISKKDITNSKIRPFWQALIILNYGDISTYYFEWNNVLMCLLHVCLMTGSGTLRECESPQPDTHWDKLFSLQWLLFIGQRLGRSTVTVPQYSYGFKW